ncbi:MAG: DUF551 domain-containing protein [Burkholderiales bacterium]|nr:DUF551 domain-containing protein [Burkholderiales bacterium]
MNQAKQTTPSATAAQAREKFAQAREQVMLEVLKYLVSNVYRRAPDIASAVGISEIDLEPILRDARNRGLVITATITGDRSYEWPDTIRVVLATKQGVQYVTDHELPSSAWQPIATAPSDGTHVLIWGPRWGFQVATITDYGREPFDTRNCHSPWSRNPDVARPTHWMPLPAPPTEQRTDK